MGHRRFGGFATSTLIAGAILWSFATTDVAAARKRRDTVACTSSDRGLSWTIVCSLRGSQGFGNR